MMRAPDTVAAAGPADASPVPVDAHSWFEQHELLTHDFVAAMGRASLVSTDAARATAYHAHNTLIQHAKLVLGEQVPIVLAKDGRHVIEYSQLAEARAKVRALREENDRLREALVAPRQTPDRSSA